MDIQGSWADDSDGNRFLIDDNNNNDNRIIVFGTDHCLEHLSGNKSSPTFFKQLYVIGTTLDGSAVSVVHAFLSSKSEDTYIEMLQR